VFTGSYQSRYQTELARTAYQSHQDDKQYAFDTFASGPVDAFGRTFDVLAGHNLVAIADGKLAGLISLALDRGELAIVLLSVYPEYQGSGVGGALVEAAAALASERRLPSLKVATSNDDIAALYFYQRRGFVFYQDEMQARSSTITARWYQVSLTYPCAMSFACVAPSADTPGPLSDSRRHRVRSLPCARPGLCACP